MKGYTHLRPPWYLRGPVLQLQHVLIRSILFAEAAGVRQKGFIHGIISTDELWKAKLICLRHGSSHMWHVVLKLRTKVPALGHDGLCRRIQKTDVIGLLRMLLTALMPVLILRVPLLSHRGTALLLLLLLLLLFELLLLLLLLLVLLSQSEALCNIGLNIGGEATPRAEIPR